MNEYTLSDLSPDEAHLVDELRGVAAQMTPDSHFKDELEAHLLAVERSASISEALPAIPLGSFASGLRMRLRLISTIAAVFVLLIIATLTIPPLRAIAQEVIDTLFNRTDADQETVELGPRGIIQLVPYYFGTIEEAEAKAGFDIRAPAYLPAGVKLHDITYSPEEQLMSLNYFTMTITQGPLKNGWSDNPLLSVGESADVTPVQLRIGNADISAEFVKGFWTNPPDEPASSFPEQPAPVDLQWDSSLPVCRLRWQDTNLMYEIWSYANDTGDACRFGINDLVAIAESMG